MALVDVTANGPVLAALFSMATESKNCNGQNDNGWMRWVPMAVIPFFLQNALLDYLTQNLKQGLLTDETYFYAAPEPIFTMFGIVIFLYEAFGLRKGI